MPGCACSVPASGNQQLVGAYFTVPGGQHEFAANMGDLAGLRVLQHLDALGTESSCHGLADGRVFPEEQGAARRMVTLLPSRAKVCASSSATTDSRSRRAFGNGVADQSLGRSPEGDSFKPGIKGTAGLAPVATGQRSNATTSLAAIV